MKKYNVAVCGATGLVGRTMLEVLEEQNFPVNQLFPIASKRSVGKKLPFQGRDWTVTELTEESFDQDIDIALFSCGATLSKKFAPIAAEKGILVIDNSSAWRMTVGIPLIVPEVNPEDFRMPGIIANPNCSTIQCMSALKALKDLYGIKRVVYSTYQACAGAGMKGLRDLKNGTTETFDYPITRNILVRIDDFLDNGYTKEEMKMINETRKILHEPDLPVTATAARVPVDYAHCVSVNVELKKDFDLDEVREAMNKMPGLVVKDDPQNLQYPMPVDAKGRDQIFVGRIRRDFSQPNTLNMWIVADNVRKGAATNSVQIAQLALKQNK